MPKWWTWMTDNLVIGRVRVGSMIAVLIIAILAVVGWVIFSAIVDAFPLWSVKALLLILGGTVVHASIDDGKKKQRIAELEQELERRKQA
jgi:hypothetical protein